MSKAISKEIGLDEGRRVVREGIHSAHNIENPIVAVQEFIAQVDQPWLPIIRRHGCKPYLPIYNPR